MSFISHCAPDGGRQLPLYICAANRVIQIARKELVASRKNEVTSSSSRAIDAIERRRHDVAANIAARAIKIVLHAQPGFASTSITGGMFSMVNQWI
jgi:hypothetical protein